MMIESPETSEEGGRKEEKRISELPIETDSMMRSRQSETARSAWFCQAQAFVVLVPPQLKSSGLVVVRPVDVPGFRR